jgi:predicted ATPase
LVGDDDVNALRLRTAEASTDRMMRELASAIEAVTTVVPVVVVCEDLHAADRPSVELISYLARRPHPARLLVLCTYRPAEASVRSHPVRNIAADLRVRQQCRYLDLELLSPPAVRAYLARRLAPAEPAASLVDFVHERTDGNALFLSMLVDYLVERDLLIGGEQGLRYRDQPDEAGVPDTVREFVERQLDELPAADRAILKTASAIGVGFATEAVVAAMQIDRPDLHAIEIEDRLDALARDVGLLAESGVLEWPDRTVTTHYHFRHAIYQQPLYSRLRPTRRAAIHRRIGERLAAGFGSRAGEIAAELAMQLYVRFAGDHRSPTRADAGDRGSPTLCAVCPAG